ncbi:MAG: hypothetical protein DSZ23_04250, partial [Thermodesulfatator sp.]
QGRKMSPKNKNVITVKELLKEGFTGRQIRFFLLRSYYRKPVTFSFKAMKDACRGLSRIDVFKSDLNTCLYLRPEEEESRQVKKGLCRLKRDFFAAMLDDLNTSAALGAVFSFIRKTNPMIGAGQINQKDAESIIKTFKTFDSLLAVLDFTITRKKLPQGAMELIEERERARQEKRFHHADQIRKTLLGLGIELMDTPRGPRLRFKGQSRPDSDKKV